LASTENRACATVRRAVRDFETELITEIAADERSKEFTFLVFYGSANTSKKALPAISKALSRPHWMLGIDFIPGEAKQNWWLGPPVGPYFGGKADAKEIARKICSIVRSQTSSAIATSNSARRAAKAPALDLPELVKKHLTTPFYRLSAMH
jgi:hypothetical protein